MEETSYVLTKNLVSCVPARFLFHCRSFSPYWPLKFINFILKFDFFLVFVFCFIPRSSPFSVKTPLYCCCCFSFSKSPGGQDDHNIDVYHLTHRLQPRHRKTDHFTLATQWCERKDGWTGGRAYGHVTTKISRMHEQPNFLSHGAPLESSAIQVLITIRTF